MKKMKLNVSSDIKSKLYKLDELLKDVPLDNAAKGSIYAGACGEQCMVTCAWHCEAACGGSCIHSCTDSCDATYIGPNTNACTYKFFPHNGTTPGEPIIYIH